MAKRSLGRIFIGIDVTMKSNKCEIEVRSEQKVVLFCQSAKRITCLFDLGRRRSK